MQGGGCARALVALLRAFVRPGSLLNSNVNGFLRSSCSKAGSSLSVIGLHLILFFLALTQTPFARASSTIFGGGPFYTGGTSAMNVLRASGYSTVMLWCIHVDSSTG